MSLSFSGKYVFLKYFIPTVLFLEYWALSLLFIAGIFLGFSKRWGGGGGGGGSRKLLVFCCLHLEIKIP